MLERIKKRYQDGFKDFVLSLETSPPKIRGQIFLNGLLEDPIFMSHVVKNIRCFDDLISLRSHDLSVIFSQDRHHLGLFAMGVFNSPDRLTKFEIHHPAHVTHVRRELSFMSSISKDESEKAQSFLIKIARTYQTEGKIKGFDWVLPPEDLYLSKKKGGDGPVKIDFENGTCAAHGKQIRGKREGKWFHYYETGALLAVGNYSKGMKEGEWKFFYSNGNLKGVGEFRRDVRDGLWIDWDRSGELTESTYENGLKKKD
jgi:hypothetical protein